MRVSCGTVMTFLKSKTSLILVLICVKILLFPFYHSTDFDVHHNWLNITHSLPLDQWYHDEKSPHTLDYPPFFAWFEYALSFPLTTSILSNHDLMVLYQRTSVILSEVVLDPLLAATPGIIMYNGFLFGILVASLKAKNPLIQALLFSTLLNFKHIFLYIAPAFTLHLFFTYCFINERFSMIRFTKLGIITLFPFIVSFGPFYADLPQIGSRLFPFKRGLLHAYWAPNFWALYAATDKIVSRLFSMRNPSLTRGIVGDVEFAVLPSVPPSATFLLTLVSMTPSLWKIIKYKTRSAFIYAVAGCAFSSFLFGWHVHEKAILIVIIPLTLLPQVNVAKIAWYGYASLMPLLWRGDCFLVKWIIFLLFFSFLRDAGRLRIDAWMACVWVVGIVEAIAFVCGYTGFAPVMLYSLYCAVGLVWCWFDFLRVDSLIK